MLIRKERLLRGLTRKCQLPRLASEPLPPTCCRAFNILRSICDCSHLLFILYGHKDGNLLAATTAVDKEMAFFERNSDVDADDPESEQPVDVLLEK